MIIITFTNYSQLQWIIITFTNYSQLQWVTVIFFYCFASCHRPKKIVALPLLLFLPQPTYMTEIVASPNNNNCLIAIAITNNNMLTNAKKKICNTRLWMRIDQSSQLESSSNETYPSPPLYIAHLCLTCL